MADEDKKGPRETKKFLEGYTDVNDFTQKTLKSVLLATKASNILPAAGDDFDFYSSFQSVRDILDVEGKRILYCIQSVLKHQNVKGKLSGSSDVLDLEDKFDVLTDANDQILERVGTWLDEASGIKKTEATLVVASATPKQATTSWNKKTPSAQKPTTSFQLLSAKNIQRPQLRFKEKVDNSNKPFMPSIKCKPNAKRSLEDSLKLPRELEETWTEDPDFLYPHPYQHEIDTFQAMDSMLQFVEPIDALPMSLADCTMVSTVHALKKMLEFFKTQNIIAVDLEHHSYRTFQGILCLMQISTRTKDFVIDTIELREELSLLNEVFTDPNILKVFHGADMDIQWLQRDLGVYVVNMFDTGQAARVLNMSRFSLAHLLQVYCGIQANKQYQLADWRIRPLPDELLKYAVEDTHYLLYIYDKLRNELLERGNEQKNMLMSVIHRSNQIAATVYKKNIFKPDDYLELYHKSKKIFNSQQMMALKNIYSWRDQTARAEDESLGYVLPNHMLLQIAEILPRERQGIFACCNPIPPLVRQYLIEIHDIVSKAREEKLVKTISKKIKGPTQQQHPKYNSENLLLCPHDLSHSANIVDVDAFTSLLSDIGHGANPNLKIDKSIQLKELPILTAFMQKTALDLKTKAHKVAEEIKSRFVSPIEKFLPKPAQKTLLSRPKLSEAQKTTDDTWVLLRNTEKRKLSETTTEGPPTKKKRIEQTEEEGAEEDDTEPPPKTLKQLKAEYNRLQKAERLSVNPSLPDEGKPVSKKKKKKMERREEELEVTKVQPFDYSQTTSSMFLGETSDSSHVFNPHAGGKRKGSKAEKPKLSTGKSNKSISYAGKNISVKKSWPKNLK